MFSLKKALIELKNQAVRPYYSLRTWEPIWSSILNRKARAAFAKNPSILNPAQAQAIKDLKEKGIAITHLEDLFPDVNALKNLTESAQAFMKQAATNPKKKFQTQLWDTVPVLSLDNPFVAFSLDPAILGIVGGYLELFPTLFYYSLWIAQPINAGDEPVLSQCWHRDPEDKRMCKVFIYLNDVDETTGPFHYIPQSHDGGKWRHVYPQQPPYGSHPKPGQVEAIIPESETIACLGRAGTVIFADTSGLHKGGYATHKQRLMFQGGYYSSASPRKKYYTLPPDWESAKKNLSPMAKFATQRQKK